MRKVARFALLAAGLGVVPVLAQDDGADEDDGGGFLERQIENRLSSDGMQVRVRGFQGALSSRATIEQITISDEEGTWLTVNDAVLDWTRTALLRGRLQVEELSAAEIILPRLPQGGEQPADVPSPEAEPFSLPELPVSINLEQLAIERVELGQPIIGTAAVLQVSGGAQLADGSGQVNIEATRVDDEQGQFDIEGSFDNESNELSVDVALDEGPDGIVANLIDLPGRPSVALSVEGSGRLSDFDATLALQTDGEPRLDGTLSLAEVDGASQFAVDLGGDVTALFNPEYRPFFGPDVQLQAEGATLPEGGFRLSALDLSAQSLSLTGQVAVGADGVPDLIDVRGQIASDDGPVVLPAGQDVQVGRVGLDVRFDASQGDDWTGLISLDNLETPTASIERIALDGAGIIAGSGESLDVEAGFDFAAAGLALDDPGLANALGDAIDGRLEIGFEAGEPITMGLLRLAGAGFALEGQGQVDPDGENVPLELTAALDAEDFSAFSALAGRPLSGAGQLELDLSAEALSGAFDVDLGGTTQDLAVGVPELDPLLDGATELALDARRDETGLRVETLSVQNPDLDLQASADLTSDGGTANADLTVADLSQVDPDLSGPATLTFTAERPDDEWDLVLEAEGAEADIAGTATLSDLDADSPLARFDLSVAAADLSNFSVFAGRELGGAVDLSTEGSARLDASTVDATLAGTTTDVAIGQGEVDNLLAGVTEIDAAVQRAGDEIAVPRLLVQNPQITVTGEADVAPGNSSVEARIGLADLARVVDTMSGPATIVLEATEDGEDWNVDLDGDGAGARIVADALVQGLRDTENAPLIDGSAELAVADLSVFSDLAGRELNGTVDLSLDGRGRTDLSVANADVSGRASDVVIGVDEVDALLAGATQLAFRGEKDGERIVVEDLTLENPQIDVAGSARYGTGDGAADLTVALADLAEIVPAMSGDARIALVADEGEDGWTIDLEGTGAGAEIAADATVTDLDTVPLVDGTARVGVADLSVFSDIAGRELGGQVNLDVTGRARSDLSEAAAQVRGRTNDLALGQAELDRLFAGVTELALAGEKDGEALSLRTLNLQNPQVSVTGQGAYGPGQNAAEASIVFPELSAIVPEMTGEGRVTLDARETEGDWQVTLDGTGAGVVLDAAARIADLEETPSVDGRVEMSAEDLSRFSRLAGQPLAGQVSLQAEGSGRVDGGRFDVTADARARGVRTGIAQVDDLLAGGPTALDLSAARERAAGPIRVRTLRLDSPGLDVTADGQVLGGASNLTLNARLANLATFVEGLDGPVTAQGQVGQSGQNVTLDLDVSGPQGTNAAIGGTVAQSFDRADLDVTGSLPLSLGNPFLDPNSLSGTARFDLGVNGPLEPRSVTGTVTLADGRFVSPTVPAVLENISGTARLSGGQVQLNITADKDEGGQIRVAGPISLDPGYDANLAIQIGDVVFEDPRLYRTILAGQVDVTGPLTGGATIGGLIRLGETELRVPSTGLGATGPIPDGLVHVGENAAVTQTLRRAGLLEDPDAEAGGSGGGGVAYPLDLTILAENQIFIRGRGLDAELGGQLTLGGTTANVVPSGQFDLIRGRLDLLGQRIDLSEGVVTLQGNFDPVIRLVAEADTGEVTVFIIVEGQATEPDISFQSAPELPEDEVLSRLLFGQSIDNISPLQAAQLASAVATLAGRGGGGIVNNLRESTGLDDLDVTTDSEGNVGLQAGKYISENVYTDVTVDSAGEAEINLNLDVTDSVTFRGGTSNEGDASLGVFFERDY